jgi:hypothetical protein
MTTYSLEEILRLIVKWEKRLDSFYDVMEEYLTNERSRKTTLVLQERQKKTVEALEKINIKDYARTEFIKNIPDSHSEDLIPHFEIDADSSPKEVFETILGYEEKLEEYYARLKDVLVYIKSKELLDMLLRFKVGQIKEIKSLMDSYDLAL